MTRFNGWANYPTFRIITDIQADADRNIRAMTIVSLAATREEAASELKYILWGDIEATGEVMSDLVNWIGNYIDWLEIADMYIDSLKVKN